MTRRGVLDTIQVSTTSVNALLLHHCCMETTKAFRVEDDDEDIQYLYTNNQEIESVTCQICRECLDHLTLEERGEHYGLHFIDEDSNPNDSGAKKGMSSKLLLSSNC